MVGLINNNDEIDNDHTFVREWKLDELFEDPKNVNPLCYKENCIKHYKEVNKVSEKDWDDAKSFPE